jgi:GH24 family phage-related lysozyme (muramidase)
VQKSTPIEPVKRRITSTLDGGQYWVAGKNISYGYPAQYIVPNGASQKGIKIATANGVSLYRLKIANPEINFDLPIKSGTVVKIPGIYIITPGSVRSFDDVVKATGIDKHYIKDILIGIEGRKQKPDLVCKSDNVRSKEYPNGCPTIGFGHTGRVDGKVIVNGKTKITETKAYELLAQDILNAKVDALVYMGKPLFNSAPESVQTGIIDVVFNKGVEPFDREGSPTRLIKKDLEKTDYASAAAHTVLKTANRGLKKRNVYRVIMSTEDLSKEQRNKALKLAHSHYINTLRQFSGQKCRGERAYMQRAWANAQKGKTYDFFSK